MLTHSTQGPPALCGPLPGQPRSAVQVGQAPGGDRCGEPRGHQHPARGPGSHTECTGDTQRWRQTEDSAPTGVAQWDGRSPTKQKVTSSTLGRGTCLGHGFSPRLGSYKRQPNQCFSPFLPRSLKSTLEEKDEDNYTPVGDKACVCGGELEDSGLRCPRPDRPEHRPGSLALPHSREAGAGAANNEPIRPRTAAAGRASWPQDAYSGRTWRRGYRK